MRKKNDLLGWLLMGMGGLCLIVYLTMAAQNVKRIQWEIFEECIEDNPTDTVCDSCYRAIISKQ
jgi:hypothetical protein